MDIEWRNQSLDILLETYIFFGITLFELFREYKTEEWQTLFEFTLKGFSNLCKSRRISKEIKSNFLQNRLAQNHFKYRFPWSAIIMRIVRLRKPLLCNPSNHSLTSASATPTKLILSCDSSP